MIGAEQLYDVYMRRRRSSKRADCSSSSPLTATSPLTQHINITSSRDFNTFSSIMESMSDHSIFEIIEREASNLHELVLNCLMELEKMANV